MRSQLLGVLACSLLAVPVLGTSSATLQGTDDRVSDSASNARRDAAIETFRSQPLRFEPNLGQADEHTRYVARGPGFAAFVTADGLVFAMAGAPETTSDAIATVTTPGTMSSPVLGAVSMRLRGGDLSHAAEPGDRLPGVSNYLKGDRSQWATHVPGYASVRFPSVYPGIDLVLHGERGAFEYDFEVRPGANASDIRIELEGPQPAVIDPNGEITMTTDAGVVRQAAPAAFQDVAAGRQQVPSRFVELGAGVFSFDVGAYDATRPLVIDPVLSFSTYLGGDGADSGYGVAVDKSGRFYVCGFTISSDFFVFHPYQTLPQGGYDAFVTKFTHGPQPVFNYSTYLGGSLADVATSVAVDRDESAYITGGTFSTDFPTHNPLQIDPNDTDQDAFVAKLNSEGDDLVYSTYLGGGGGDYANDIAVDRSGNAFVGGVTASMDFPVSHALQGTTAWGPEDAFVAELNANGTALTYSTYLGGTAPDGAVGIAIDSTGAAYVTGNTASTDFPLVSAEQQAAGGGIDAFVAKIAPAGGALVYSTYLGGTANEFAGRIAVDAAGAVVTGYTASIDFPTHNAIFPDQSDGKLDVYVTRLAPNGSSLVFSTYLGGNDDDISSDIAIGQDGNIYVIGSTKSTNFPTVNFFQNDGDGTVYDAFITEMNGSGSELLFSTYLGGGLPDAGISIAVSGSDVVVATGQTLSTNFPLSNAVEGDPNDSAYDAFVVRIGSPIADVGIATLDVAPVPLVRGSAATLDVSVANAGPDTAGDVFLTLFMESTEFQSAEVSQGDYYLEPYTPETDVVRCEIGRLANGASATVHVDYVVLPSAADSIHVFAYFTTSALDSNYLNNELYETRDVVTITPPDITGVQSLVVSGKPYRVKITGSNFQPGVQVFIAMEPAPWPSVKYKSLTTLVMKGSGLKQEFPKGVPVLIRVQNPDGGSDTQTFVR